jgi:OOP family OmpA-OmpF porin
MCSSLRLLAILAMVAAVFGVAATSAGAQTTTQDWIETLRKTGGPSRGIKQAPPASPVSSATTSPRPPSHPPGQRSQASNSDAPEPSNEHSGDLIVQFKSGSAELTPQAASTLDTLGQAIASPDLAGLHFRIEGHTDTVGTPDANKALSEQRAQAVVSYLITKFHVDATRLQPIGMGEEGLAVSTPPQTPEQRNRRVHVVRIDS